MSEPQPFKFTVQTHDTNALLIEMCLKIRASIDALAVFNTEILAHLTGKSHVELAERYGKLVDEFVLEHAYLLQKNNPTTPSE